MDKTNNMLRGYGLNDVSIVPFSSIDLKSRTEINENFNKLIWVSPMDSILDLNNIDDFYDKDLNVPMVRGMWKDISVTDLRNPLYLTFSLKEAINILKDGSKENLYVIDYIAKFSKLNLLIDIANGHLSTLWDLTRDIKNLYSCNIMIGNIANPMTYKLLDENANVDYVRVGIGSGSRCHTSSKTGIHYPIISLISKIKKIKTEINSKIQIIADGGIRDSSDIAKLFVAGADGVMLGNVFAKTLESAGIKYRYNEEGLKEKFINNLDLSILFENKDNIYLSYRGMSTKEVQTKEGKINADYEEGFAKEIKVEYTLSSLLKELNKSLKSSFSYCNSKNLNEFYEKSIFIQNFNNNFNQL